MTTQYSDDDSETLLPWHLNGTLTPEESEKVEVWLKREGVSAEQELALLGKMRDHLQADKIDGPGELGWRRLRRDLKSEPVKPRNARWYRTAMAAAVAIIALQGFLIGQQWLGRGNLSDWQTLSGEAAPAAQFQISFQPQATEQQVRDLLQANQLQIVEGPSAAGLYRLRSTADTTAGIERQVKQLSQAVDVVRHVAED